MTRQDSPLESAWWDSSVSNRDPSNGTHDHFPLPDGYFPDIHLTAKDILNYESQMQDIVKNALVEFELHEAQDLSLAYRAPWTVVGKVEGLTTVKKETADNSTSSISRIFGRVNGDYRHFIDFFYAETSAQLFAWNQIMFGYASDAAVLRNIHTVASKKECLYMGIKWTCLQPSSLVKKRDNCYMEYLIYTQDLRGRNVGVRVTLPLDIPECPKLPQSFKTKRMRLNTVWISRPSDLEPNTTDFFMMSQNDFKGFVVTANYYKRMMNTLMNMAVFVDSRRILMQGVMQRKRWAKTTSRKSCKVCSRKFGPTRRRHHCRLCGDLICRRCAIVRDAPKEKVADNAPTGSNRTFETVKTKFCLLCVTNLRESRTNMLVPVPTMSRKLSIVECNDETLDLNDICHSTLSETESEGGQVSFFSETRSSEGARSRRLSPQITAIASILDLVGDQFNYIVADTKIAAHELIEEEVAEVIETTDMIPDTMFNSSKRIKSSSYHNKADSNWPLLDPKTSPRSLHQCLAEQEELLRRMMLSASGMRQQKHENLKSVITDNSRCDLSIDIVQSSRCRRSDVTLYEV